jgi:hypothetical protein
MNGSEFDQFMFNVYFDPGPLTKNSSKLSNPVWREINDVALKRMFIYGKGAYFNPKNFGSDNVHIVGMGDFEITPIDNLDSTYEISFSKQTLTNNDHELIDEYEPVFFADPRSGSSFSVYNEKYYGAEISIKSRSFAVSQSGSIEI